MGRNRGKKSENESGAEETIKELKKANRRLKSDNERLKSELETLQEAFSLTSKYLTGNVENISVENIIKGVKAGSTLQQIKNNLKCDKCNSHNVKELKVINVGKIILCSDCKNRKVVKDEKEEKN